MDTREIIPYEPRRKELPRLSPELQEQLSLIEPSFDRDLELRPCMVELVDGKSLKNVYVVEANSYLKLWGVWPSDDPAKNSLDLSSVISIKPSPNRMPAEIANQLYLAGETAMGATIFTLSFSDGLELVYEYGNALDFICLPKGKTSDDIVDVFPHKGRDEEKRLYGPEFYWCLHNDFVESGV